MEEPQDKKLSKKSIIWIIVGVILAIVLLGGILAGTTSTDDTQDEQNIQITNIKHSLGENADYEGLNITVNNFDFTDFFAGTKPNSNTNNTLLIVNVSVTNTTNRTVDLYSTFLTYRSYLCHYSLIYDDDISYGQQWNDKLTNFLNTHDSISPLATINAALCYQIPSTVKESNKKLEIKLYNGKTDATLFHYWTLRDCKQET